jgi:mannose-6-phosphate isomerase
MANSDNVVRAGLTPKFKDVETLVDILTYEMGPPRIIEPDAAAEVVYRTPAPEFRVSRLRLEPGQERAESTGGGPAVLLVTRGDAGIRWTGGETELRRGQSVLIPALVEAFSLLAETPVELFKVTVPVS